MPARESRTMPDLCWLNGEFTPLAAARVHPLDRGLLFGDGLFETLRADSGQVFLAEAHLARLRHSAELFKLDLPFSDARVLTAFRDLLAANSLTDARLRLLLSRGLHTGNLGLPSSASPFVLITAEPLAQNLAEIQTHGVKLALSSVVMPRGFLLARHKTLNRLPYLLAREQAQAAGAFDALLLDEQGLVAETTSANLFLVQGRNLITPPLEAPILPGVTRAFIFKLAPGESLTVKEKDFPLHTLFDAEEVFLTNSIIEVTPVTEVEGRKIGQCQPGPVTRRLQAAYQASVRSRGLRA